MNTFSLFLFFPTKKDIKMEETRACGIRQGKERSSKMSNCFCNVDVFGEMAGKRVVYSVHIYRTDYIPLL